MLRNLSQKSQNKVSFVLVVKEIINFLFLLSTSKL